MVKQRAEWETGLQYTKGEARVAWAANKMGITHDQLQQEARDRGISAWGGIAWNDLLKITGELMVREPDDRRRATFRAAIVTFIETRKTAA
jgi:hypothetical protein